jgi:hypothetical protein
MLDAGENITYTYVFTGMIPALISVIFTIIGNNMAISETPERIVSETAQARNSLIDSIAVWGEFATLKEGKRSFTITDNNLTNSGANRDGRSDSRYIVGGEKDDKGRKACEAKARNKNNKIKK